MITIAKPPLSEDAPQDFFLPQLREDLEIFQAPDADDGSQVWMIRDPVHSIFEQATWAQMEIIKRLHRPCRLSELVIGINEETSLNLSEQEILAFCHGLINKGLTVSSLLKPVEILEKERRMLKSHPLEWLLKHYLYFRLPLIHPDNFLDKTIKYARFLTSQIALTLYCIIFVTGLLMLLPRIELYWHSFPRFFNWQGMLAYILAITCVKTIHEFSHAYTAKAYGNHVPTMGIAFIVMWPVPYCDVTDTWRMDSRRKRLVISIAGIAAELVIAGISLFMWRLCGDGIARSVFFVLSSVSLAGTILVNLNPAMRFDGYYLFSDIIGVDNLQPRSFTLARWFYRKHLLGLSMPCPEPSFNPRKRLLLTIYAFYAWAYRFFLYLGIALLVYYMFDNRFMKILGILLFLVEIAIFLIRPAYMEIHSLIKLRTKIKANPQIIALTSLALLFALWFILPLPRRVSFPAVTESQESQFVYSPDAGAIKKVMVERNQKVKTGEPLLILDSEYLDREIELTSLELERLQAERAYMQSNNNALSMLPRNTEELSRLHANLRGLEKKKSLFTVKASISGTITEWDQTLHAGVSLGERQYLGKIVSSQGKEICAYIPEEYASEISAGTPCKFIPDASPENFASQFLRLSPNRAKYLPHAALSSINKGEIAAVPSSSGALEIIDSYFEAEAEIIDGNNLRIGQTGKIWIWTKPRSLLASVIRKIYHTMVSESDF